MAREDDDDLWSEVSRTLKLSILTDPQGRDEQLYVTKRLPMVCSNQVSDLEAWQISKTSSEKT